MKLSIINGQDFILIVKEEHIIYLEVDFLKLIKPNMTKKCENECRVLDSRAGHSGFESHSVLNFFLL